jgi:proteasome assembly chaperone 3
MDIASAAGFPAKTKRASGLIKDAKDVAIPTDVMVVGFADKLVVTITQQGRLAQWVCFFAASLGFFVSFLF